VLYSAKIVLRLPGSFVMGELRRFGVSIEAELGDRFDAHLRAKGIPSRSEGIRDLVRNALVAAEWTGTQEVAGTISMVYDHHRRELLAKLMDLQHDYHGLTVASQHVHLQHDACLEVLIVKGPASRVQGLFDRLRAIKGMKHIAITRTTPGHRP